MPPGTWACGGLGFMNLFRSKILSGQSLSDPLIQAKSGRARVEGENLTSVSIPRSERRNVNQREEDRHRLIDEQAMLNCGDGEHVVQLINLSGGGAMVEGPLDLQLWDKVELLLGGRGTGVECAVRWIRDGRYGLEFAHETRVDCPADERHALLREVLAKNFADAVVNAAAPAPAAPLPEAATDPAVPEASREPRHPLIWSGLIHYNHESTAVRLRNISAWGAQIDCPLSVKAGAKLLLDLGEAGTIFAEAMWARGDQVGLRFEHEFEVANLARKRPDVAGSQWEQPSYLRDSGQSSPWAEQWGRVSLNELRSELEGFLKR